LLTFLSTHFFFFIFPLFFFGVVGGVRDFRHFSERASGARVAQVFEHSQNVA
jgi:hypothetical protein